jgi:hypothetical protein
MNRATQTRLVRLAAQGPDTKPIEWVRVIVGDCETREQAIERHMREHPEDRRKSVILRWFV